MPFPCVDVGPCLEQGADYFRVAVFGGGVKWCVAAFYSCLDVSPVVNQGSDCIRISFGRGGVKWGRRCAYGGQAECQRNCRRKPCHSFKSSSHCHFSVRFWLSLSSCAYYFYSCKAVLGI